ncbi:hypothetical protein [Streptomyces sp. NPDC048603]|uniref:hypothetical protein n=1 Tax=Streptomyces sp. NPDC048603 TaxID=3365577 RepID=UPI0037210970
MEKFTVGQRVRTTVDAPSMWEGGTSIPAGSFGTIKHARGQFASYGVLLDDDPDQLPASYEPHELEAV